jgi:hypothetical protein
MAIALNSGQLWRWFRLLLGLLGCLFVAAPAAVFIWVGLFLDSLWFLVPGSLLGIAALGLLAWWASRLVG